jgi:flagellar motor switch protein FliN/FliY
MSGFQKGVLGVRAPVAVVLASQPIPLSTILDLVPGAMIQFDKNCDEPLVLEVGGQPIATGEAVKVDDKFGLRVRGFSVPEGD